MEPPYGPREPTIIDRIQAVAASHQNRTGLRPEAVALGVDEYLALERWIEIHITELIPRTQFADPPSLFGMRIEAVAAASHLSVVTRERA